MATGEPVESAVSDALWPSRMFDMDKLRPRLWVIVLSAIGMLLGQWVAGYLPSSFASPKADSASVKQTISTRELEIVGADGRRQIVMGTSREGTPALWLFDKNGKARISVGLYEDGNAGIVLTDDQERAVEIFRTVGGDSSPVLVMKAEGRDRIVMGLAPAKRDPFLVYYDAAGAKTRVFGDW